MYENLTVERERIKSNLKDICPRCGIVDQFERRGSHSHPYLRCKMCGFELGCYSKTNRLVDLAVGLGFLAMLIFFFAMLAGFVVGLNAPPKEVEALLSLVA